MTSSKLSSRCCILFHFYIKPQLLYESWGSGRCCILFHFYIKPQLLSTNIYIFNVVSYSISTSNHNCISVIRLIKVLYLIPFLHQTTTLKRVLNADSGCILFHFYIKPQPTSFALVTAQGCILFHFYIKPQLFHQRKRKPSVVSYSISTSNHNLWRIRYYFQAHYHLNHILIFNGML